MQPNNQSQKPFFAQFLESQINTEVNNIQQDGRVAEQAANLTLKFPSDREDGTGGGDL